MSTAQHPGAIPPLILRRGRVDFFTKSGTIVGSSKRSETHVSVSGGGGYVGPYGGHVSPARVSERVDTVHEFWLREANGTEHALVNNGTDAINVRPDHHVTVIYAGSSKKDEFWPLVLVNHSARRYQYFNRNPHLVNATKIVFNPGCLGWLVLAPVAIFLAVVVCSFLLFWLMNAAAVVLGIFVGLLAPVWMIYRSFKRAYAKLESHVAATASDLSKRAPAPR